MISCLAQDPCGVCGYLRHGVMVSTVRVNKRSVRSYGTNLIMLPTKCLECLRVTPSAKTVTWRPAAEDTKKINDYRLRKWPELAADGSSGAG